MYPYLGHFIFPIYTYGVFLALAFLCAISLALYHGHFLGLKEGDILDMAVWFMLSSILGARVLYILLFPGQFPTWLSYVELQNGGLVFYGGFIATLITIVMYSRYYRISLRTLGDLIAPSLALGQCLGRIGCFMNACCYGSPTTSIFGVIFPHMKEPMARHPTQLYESAVSLLLVVWGSVMIRRRARNGGLIPGFIWGGYVLAYGTFRFLVEFIRDDPRGGVFSPLGLSISQIIAAIAVVGAFVWFWLCVQRHRQETLKGEAREATQ